MSNKPTSQLRIGVEIGPYDPYWVEVHESVCQHLSGRGADLIQPELAESNSAFYSMDFPNLADELLALGLDALISINLPEEVMSMLLENGLPVISVTETQLRHRRFSSLTGLYEAGRKAARFITDKLGGRGLVMGVGGSLDVGSDKGQSRVNGFCDVIGHFPDIDLCWIPSYWDYERTYDLVTTALQKDPVNPAAVFGLSDSIILAARDAFRDMGMEHPTRAFVGINGDPLALAGIVEGTVAATVETSADEVGRLAVDRAMRGARGETLPAGFYISSQLITRENVADVGLRKLVAIARITSHLVGTNRDHQRKVVRQLETSSAINRRVGALLDRRELTYEIAELIRINYAYDLVQVFLWSPKEQALILDGVQPQRIPLSEAGLLSEVIATGETIFIPDMHHSQRYPFDPRYPDTRARVVLPVTIGDEMLALLDLHSHYPSLELRQTLIGLQSLADQLGIALRNADLYAEAVQAREQAEKADQLKTRLLANVSHELRAPLNVILGYSKSALQEPNPYQQQLPAELLRDMRYIYQSGGHLIRIINDLLDLSRAEIGELCLYPEVIDLHPFLVETFTSFSRSATTEAAVQWSLDIPPTLPMIQADPARLSQILLNLLSNAVKFTQAGLITLGADVEPPYVHFWVADTGVGIPVAQQEKIFEPFVSINPNARRPGGIGLGLSITRYLIALHHGTLSLESQSGQGSIFHFYLPLPGLSTQADLAVGPARAQDLVVISTQARPSAAIQSIADRQQLDVVMVRNPQELEKIGATCQPAALAWDMSTANSSDWQLIQSILAHPQYSRLPFILYRMEKGEQAMENGLTNVLVKPVQYQSLAAFLKSLSGDNFQDGILIVDDDAQARGLYQQIVNETFPGLKVITAENGAQALQILARETPGLVLLDLLMPEVDGFTVLERLRSAPRTARLPVVVISGKVLSLDEIQRLDYARVTFQTKGLLSPDELAQTLRQTFSEKELLGQPTSRLVKFALVYMQHNYNQPLTRKALADAVGVSESYLSQIFRRELGISPWEALTRLRIQNAQVMLLASDETVTRVATRVGFNDSAYFSRVFHKITGMSPQNYRRQ